MSRESLLGNSASYTERYRDAHRHLADAQKTGDGVPAYLRWVNRPLGGFIAAGAYSLGLTPNMVTAVSASLSIVGMAVLIGVPRTVGTGALVAALFALGYAFDSADGQLARLYKHSSKRGEWLDHVVDAFRSPAVHAAVAAAIIVQAPEQMWVALVALVYGVVASGQFLSQILAGAMVRKAGKAPVRGGYLRSFLLLPTDTGTLCWVFILWGFHAPFAAAYSLLALFTVFHSAISLRRRYGDLRILDISDTARGTDHA